jgi:acetyltransferase-like isoleucine patch superfamily enzyme
MDLDKKYCEICMITDNIFRYGIYGTLRIGIDLIVSYFIFGKGVLVRRPFYIRKKGGFKLPKGFSSGPNLIIDVIGDAALLSIGEDVKINHRVHIACLDKINIGDRVLMASGVYISDHSHGSYTGANQSHPKTPPNERALVAKPVIIGNDCWLGQHVCVLPGVTIGHSVIVGAGSVVTKDIPDFCIAAGNPAKIIKKYHFTENIWEVM